ncbi:MAG: hypothetical protein WA637_20325 [Terriglobales bacterium]
MKYMEYLGGAALVGLLLLPAGAFARDKNEGNLKLFDPVRVGSTQLQPGDYKVEWNGTGPTVNVDILRDKKTVATTSAKLIGYTSGYDAVVTKPATSKTQANDLEEVDFGKQKAGLQFKPAS